MNQCQVEGCDRAGTKRKHTLCHSHYRQALAGQPFTAVKKQVRYPIPAPGKRICTKCVRVLDEAAFFRYTDGRSFAQCRACVSQQQHDYREARRAGSDEA